MNTTWDTLTPLSRGGWSGQADLWVALIAASPVVRRAVGRVWRQAAPGAITCAEELYHETVCLIAARAKRRCGLAEAFGWGTGCPEAWIAVVARHAAIDALRRNRSIPEALMNRAPLDDVPSPKPRFEDAIDLRRGIDAKAAQAATFKALPGVTPLARLAWLALEWPAALDASVVTAASRALDRSRAGNGGLARPAPEVWAKLKVWRQTHHDAPKADAARLALAWILRSDDTVGPEAWRARAPEAAARARDLVRQWHARAESHVPARCQKRRG